MERGSMLPTTRRLGYVPALDGLRGIAIALVIAYHYSGYPPGGLVGVDLFFVLSGFLITSLLLEERLASIRSFYLRRARRLFPALAVVLAAYLVGNTIAGHDALENVALRGLYFGNIALVHDSAPVAARPGALAPLWSLAQEEQFYLVWPCLLLLVTGFRRAAYWIAGLLLALVAYKVGFVLMAHPNWVRLAYGPDTHSDGLVAGALLAAIRYERGGCLNAPEWFGKVGIATLGFGAILGRLSVDWNAYALPVVELGLVLLIAAAVSDTELARGLCARPLVELGKISYSLYLWHALVWFALSAFIASRLPLSAVAIVCTLACALLSHRFVEQPFRAARRDRAPTRIGDVVSAHNSVRTFS